MRIKEDDYMEHRHTYKFTENSPEGKAKISEFKSDSLEEVINEFIEFMRACGYSRDTIWKIIDEMER